MYHVKNCISQTYAFSHAEVANIRLIFLTKNNIICKTMPEDLDSNKDSQDIKDKEKAIRVL